MKKKWIVGGACTLALVYAAFLLIANFWMETLAFDCTMLTDDGQEPVKLSLTYNRGAEWSIPGHGGQWYHAADIHGTLTGTTEGETQFEYELCGTLDHYGKDWTEPFWPYYYVFGNDRTRDGPGILLNFRKDSNQILFVTKERAVFAITKELKQLRDEMDVSPTWRKWADRIS